jgi:RimJ/RimL family protein N-acetyltransferase
VSEFAGFSLVETLRNGQTVEIRALQPKDRDGLVTAVARASTESLYRRFFSVKREFTEEEISFFLNVDFISHVALVATVQEDGQPVIIGGGRYITVTPGQAEVAFAVIDQYQGLGIGGALLRNLTAIARAAGLHELIAEVLPDNVAMLTVFEKSGLRLSTRRESGTVHIVLRLD